MVKLRELNVRMRLKPRDVKAAFEAGEVVLWDGAYYVLPLDDWAGAVGKWAQTGNVIVVAVPKARAHHRALLNNDESLLVFNLDRKPAAWVVPNDRFWRNTLEAYTSWPNPSYLVALGLRLPDGVVALTEIAAEFGVDRKNAWTAAQGAQLNAYQLDGRWVVERAEFERWYRERRPGRRAKGE